MVMVFFGWLAHLCVYVVPQTIFEGLVLMMVMLFFGLLAHLCVNVVPQTFFSLCGIISFFSSHSKDLWTFQKATIIGYGFEFDYMFYLYYFGHILLNYFLICMMVKAFIWNQGRSAM